MQKSRQQLINEIQIKHEIERRQCEKSLAAFTRSSWHILEAGNSLKWNWHLDTICGYLEAFKQREIKRLIINVPPGTMKSLLVSVFFPAWVWIDEPGHKFLGLSNEQGLCIRDALKMKWVIESEWYQSHWPTEFRKDQNEKTLYVNTDNGHRQSQGITSNVTGKRGDTMLIDDPHDAKTAQSEVIRSGVIETYDSKLSNRLNDPVESGICLIMQRLHSDDLTGHLLKKSKTKWTHVSIPMRYEGKSSFDAGEDLGRPELNDPRTKKGELLWESRFPLDIVDALEEDLGEYGTAGQHQQRPVPEGGGIIKKHWWRVWPDDVPLPKCEHIFLSWDTAFSEKDMINSAYSAMTRWGVFWHEQRQRYCLLVLGMWFGRCGYDELRKKAKEFDKEYEPDKLLIEKKATGISLIQDLRRALPGKIRSYCPGKGEDKVSRAQSATPMFSSGQVYVPNKKWAIGDGDLRNGLIDYVADFPSGSPPSADLTDTVTQACIYLRSGWWVTHPDDEDFDDVSEEKTERIAAYG